MRWVVLGVWTLLCLAGYGLLNLTGDLLAENADVVPVEPEGVVFLSGAVRFLQGLGYGLLVLVWLIGAVAILAVAAFARRARAQRLG